MTRPGSNPRPPGPEAGSLTVELPGSVNIFLSQTNIQTSYKMKGLGRFRTHHLDLYWDTVDEDRVGATYLQFTLFTKISILARQSENVEMGALLRYGLLLTLFILVSATNPGVKLRVAQRGLIVASDISQQFVVNQLRNLPLDDISGGGPLSWKLTGLQTQEVTVPISSLSFDPSHNAVSWSLRGLTISVEANYSSRIYLGRSTNSFSGVVDAFFSGVSASVSVQLGSGSDGRPSLNVASCSASVGSVSLRFRWSVISWLIDKRDQFESGVQRKLPNEICKLLKKSINENGNSALSQLKVNTALGSNLALDYSLFSPPVVTDAYVDILYKGEVYWSSDRRRPPYTPQPIPDLYNTRRMFNLWMTEYPAQSSLFAAYNHGFLKLGINQKDLRGRAWETLNTTCRYICLGNLIPEIGLKYPNRHVKMVASANSVPDFSITPRGITLTVNGNIDMYAESYIGHRPGYLLTLNMVLSLSVKPAIVNERLVGEISGHSFKLGFVRSEVGQFNPTNLNSVLYGVTNQVVVPYVNRIFQQGVDLPVTGDVTFRDTKLDLLQGCLLVATDVDYDYPPFRGHYFDEIEEEAIQQDEPEEEALVSFTEDDNQTTTV